MSASMSTGLFILAVLPCVRTHELRNVRPFHSAGQTPQPGQYSRPAAIFPEMFFAMSRVCSIAALCRPAPATISGTTGRICPDGFSSGFSGSGFSGSGSGLGFKTSVKYRYQVDPASSPFMLIFPFHRYGLPITRVTLKEDNVASSSFGANKKGTQASSILAKMSGFSALTQTS